MLVRRFVCNTILLLGLSGTIFAIGCHDGVRKAICGTNDPSVPHLSTRGPDTAVTEELFQWEYCDVFAIDLGQWYHSEITMTRTCPDMYMCGTKFPIWLQGDNPKENEGVVNLTACLRDYDTCCLRTYSISAVNCGETMAYCFNELPSECHQRYCFDVKGSSTNSYQKLPSSTTPMQTLEDKQTSTLFGSSGSDFRTTLQGSHIHSPSREETNQQTTVEPLKSSFAQSELSTNPTHILTKSARADVHIMENKESTTITILVACIGLLLATIIAFVVVLFLRRRGKPSKISDTQAKQPTANIETIKTLHGLMSGDMKFNPDCGYETLKSRYIGSDYATLKKVYLESVDKSTNIGHHEMLKEHEMPNKTDEEADYQILP